MQLAWCCTKTPPTLLPHTVPLCLLLIFWRTDYENIVTAFKIEPVWGTSSRKKTGKAKKTSFYSESETESGSESGMKGVIFYFVLLFVKKMSVFVWTAPRITRLVDTTYYLNSETVITFWYLIQLFIDNNWQVHASTCIYQDINHLLENLEK